MGYVIPFSFYQYKDYQRRTGRKEHNSHYIERPYKAILNDTHKNIEKQKDVFSKYSRPSVSSDGSARHHHQSCMAKEVYTEVTGKGQHINESI